MVNPQFPTNLGTPTSPDFLENGGDEEEIFERIREEEAPLNDPEELPTPEEEQKIIEICLKHLKEGEIMRDSIMWTDFNNYCLVRLPEDNTEPEMVYVLNDHNLEVIVNERNIIKMYAKAIQMLQERLEQIKKEMESDE